MVEAATISNSGETAGVGTVSRTWRQETLEKGHLTESGTFGCGTEPAARAISKSRKINTLSHLYPLIFDPLQRVPHGLNLTKDKGTHGYNPYKPAFWSTGDFS